MIARRLAGAIFVLALGLCALDPARAQSIAAMTNDLQALQVKVAAGDKAAYEAQRERLKAIGAAIQAAKPETWKDKNETDAAVIYLLSGGRPREIIQLLQSGAVPQSETPLMRGALAYIVGDEGQARSLLDGIDPRSLDFRLAGQFAYANPSWPRRRIRKRRSNCSTSLGCWRPAGWSKKLRSGARSRSSPKSATSTASSCFAGNMRPDFGHSVYADRFLGGVVNAALRADLIKDLPSFQKFHNFVSRLTPEERGRFLLTVAREETVNGEFAVAGVASGEALQEAPGDSVEEARGRLYEASARIMTPEYDSGLAELQSVAEAKLDTRDQALLGAVRSVASYLRQPPPDGSPPPASDPARPRRRRLSPSPKKH